MRKEIGGSISAAPGANQPETFALSLLYSAELAGLRIDQSALVKEARARGDSWFCAVGEAAPAAMTLNDIFRQLLEQSTAVAVLHESSASDPSAAWTQISYRALWSHPRIGLLWSIGFWSVTALLGWVLICLALPLRIEQPVSIIYWIAAMVWVPLVCVPPKICERIKERFRKPKTLNEDGRREL